MRLRKKHLQMAGIAFALASEWALAFAFARKFAYAFAGANDDAYAQEQIDRLTRRVRVLEHAHEPSWLDEHGHLQTTVPD